MKNKNALYYIVTVLFILALLFPLQDKINQLKEDRGLIETDIFKATTPSDVWGTMLLAGFRGIAVDLLWVRAMELQQEAKFLELLSLYKMILALQPHFLPVWTYSAWNMAYNISHDCETLEEKWNWIQKGTGVLKEGIEKNPGRYLLYFELGWIYFHKCTAEDYYLKQLEKEGKNNFEVAISWFEKATEHPPYPAYIDRMIAHAWGKRAEQAEAAGQLEEKKKYERLALLKWEDNIKKYPDDELSRQIYLEWKNKLTGEN